MKPAFSIVVLCFCIQSRLPLFAQYNTNQNKVWTFGTHAGLNFNTGAPVPFVSGINANKGCASVSDSAGNLLFYTDGDTVYNRLGNVMPSGVIAAFYNSNQGAVIVPVPHNRSQYYIFSLGEPPGSITYRCTLAYSVVDMSLDTALGDVVTTSAGIIIDTGFAGQMTAIPGASCNVWLVIHRYDSVSYWAYNITSSGISSPVVSDFGILISTTYDPGVMKASPNGLKLASQNYAGRYGTDLFDFNPATGVLSNLQPIDTVETRMAAEFSPDNTKLYSQQWGPVVDQYDISLPTTSAIAASQTAINGSVIITAGDFKLAPDNKIYMCDIVSGHVGCIPNPNIAGTGCGFIGNAVDLATGTTTDFEFPNSVVVVPRRNVGVISGADTVCYPLAGTTITTLSDTTLGGAWLSTNSNFTISGGAVSFISPGLPLTDTVYYIVNNICGSDTVLHVISAVLCPDEVHSLNTQSGQIIITPNPAHDKLTIAASDKITSVAICNLLGQMLFSSQYDSPQVRIDVADLPAGVYFVRVNDTELRKFIKQ